MRRRSNITIGRAEEAVMNVPHEAILRAFLMGAPMEAIRALLGGEVDVEAAIRAELQRIADEHSATGARRTARKPAPAKKAKPGRSAHRAAGPPPAQAKPAQPLWLDTIRTAITAIGPASIHEISEHLAECDIKHNETDIREALTHLRKLGEVALTREGGMIRWRLSE